MINLNRHETKPAVFKHLFMALLGAATLFAAGCSTEERDENDGTIINAILLPTDVVLNLHCADVGIHPETCVLDDPENPFATTTILEFDVNDPDATNKFDLFNSIPAGPTGAKARFYFWATALARRGSGENQFYTALALHELFDANSNVLSKDELVRAQALKAYQSVLDNFFGSVTVFTCCPGASPVGEPVAFSVPLNELTADNLYRTDATGFLRLIEGDPLLMQEQLLEWGYSYQPANPPNYDDGVVSVNGG
ncbi:MAG: hypothetical protein OEU90_09075 [Gammaproteobacteria bacterium]|jgi:hypothetical protein|nr:hypothetical protein [Gammaproteobacteria bacterium]MDH3750460.1 hypothetical protein [Gammaproteobacteria bacterium]MDH3805607.1 hypothetical protein [Gammaproteobacteria bacterium]